MGRWTAAYGWAAGDVTTDGSECDGVLIVVESGGAAALEAL